MNKRKVLLYGIFFASMAVMVTGLMFLCVVRNVIIEY
jgi:hypothetical protein